MDGAGFSLSLFLGFPSCLDFLRSPVGGVRQHVLNGCDGNEQSSPVLRSDWRALGAAAFAVRVSLANAVSDPVINLGLQPADAIRAELNPPRKTAGGFHAVDMIPGITDAA